MRFPGYTVMAMTLLTAPVAARAATLITGEVVSVDGPRLTVRADDARSVVLTTEAATRYLKTKPGATSLDGAETIAAADVAVGDRVLASAAASGETMTARQVVVMTRGDLAEKQARERALWRERGTAGVVTAVDAARQEITLRTAGTPALVVSTAEKKAAFRRYAPDTVRLSDARPSSFEEVEVGDQLRALGERNAEGTRLTAEHVVSGAFRTIVGAVLAVDAAAGEVQLAASPKEKVVVHVAPDTALKRLPKERAAEIARGEEGKPRTNLGDMLDRLPVVPLAELKPGDQVAVSSTRGRDAGHVTAIAVVAGIEPLLAPAPSRRVGGAAMMPGLPSGSLDMGMSF
jgi:hypothetical protein